MKGQETKRQFPPPTSTIALTENSKHVSRSECRKSRYEMHKHHLRQRKGGEGDWQSGNREARCQHERNNQMRNKTKNQKGVFLVSQSAWGRGETLACTKKGAGWEVRGRHPSSTFTLPLLHIPGSEEEMTCRRPRDTHLPVTAAADLLLVCRVQSGRL